MHFPLESAYLCQDCNAVGNNARECPACASKVLMGLSAVLNREEEEVRGPLLSLPKLAYGSDGLRPIFSIVRERKAS